MMKIEVGKSFVSAVDMAIRACKTSTSPVSPSYGYLRFVWLDARPDGVVSVWVYGTTSAMRVDCEATVKRPGRIGLLGNVSVSLMKQLPEEKGIIISSGKREQAVISAGGANYRVSCTSEDPPSWPEHLEEYSSLVERDLHGLVSRALVSTMGSPPRDCFLGSMISFLRRDRLLIVASSTGSFHFVGKVPCKGKIDKEIVVSNEMLKRLVSCVLSGDSDRKIKLFLGEHTLHVKRPGMEYIMVRMATRFVPIHQLQRNGKPEIDITLPARGFGMSVSRISVIAQDGMGSDLVKLLISPGKVVMEASSAAAGLGREVIRGDVKGKATLGLNVRQLSSAISGLGGKKINIQYHGRGTPCCVTADGNRNIAYLMSVYGDGEEK